MLQILNGAKNRHQTWKSNRIEFNRFAITEFQNHLRNDRTTTKRLNNKLTGINSLNSLTVMNDAYKWDNLKYGCRCNAIN